MGLFTVLSSLKPWFHPTVHVAVMVKAALEHVCIPALRFILPVFFHQCFVLFQS
jgi:hypothetical protein